MYTEAWHSVTLFPQLNVISEIDVDLFSNIYKHFKNLLSKLKRLNFFGESFKLEQSMPLHVQSKIIFKNILIHVAGKCCFEPDDIYRLLNHKIRSLVITT